MKKHQKLFSCCLIVALCAGGMLLGGCKKAREKRHNLAVASSAVVNAMMVTNPLGALFGNDADQEAAKSGVRQSAAALSGCPAISLQTDIAHLLFYQTITITYAPDCLVNGVAMSGTVTGNWQLKKEGWWDLYLDSQLTMDAMKVEGLTTNGSMHQMVYFDFGKSLTTINGAMTTTHADGRTRGMAFDNLTAEVSLNNFLHDLLHGSSTLTVPGLVINGSSKYTDEDGNIYAMDFAAVTQQFTCGMPTSGTVHIVNTVKEYDALIDYGDGTCNTLVNITMAGEDPQEVDMRDYLKKRQYRF